MNRKIILLSVILLAAGCAPQSTPTASPIPPTAENPDADFPHISLGEGLYLRQIRADVFVATHAFPWPANSLIVEMGNSDLVLAGTPYTPEAMQIVLDWIAERFGKRNIVAINTGYHVDNLGGNSALIERGIPVYGSDLTARLLEERGEQTRKLLLAMLAGPDFARYYSAHAEIPYVPPSELFPIDKGLNLSFGNESLEVFYPGPSQAPDKVVVFFPARKLLFGGCMILSGERIGNAADADLEHWPKAVEKLRQFDAGIIVPGHGDRLDPGLIDHTLALLAAGL